MASEVSPRHDAFYVDADADAPVVGAQPAFCDRADVAGPGEAFPVLQVLLDPVVVLRRGERSVALEEHEFWPSREPVCPGVVGDGDLRVLAEAAELLPHPDRATHRSHPPELVVQEGDVCQRQQDHAACRGDVREGDGLVGGEYLLDGRRPACMVMWSAVQMLHGHML